MDSKLILIILIIIFCLFYMGYTLVFYKYCENSLKTGKFLVTENKNELYSNLCKELYTDYSNHILLKQTINKFYDILISQTKLDVSEIEFYVNSVDLSTLRLMMKVLKIVHLALYGSVLYIAIVILPIYSIKLLKYILSKILFIIFIIFILDALLKIHFDINIDVFQFFDKSFYMNNLYFSKFYSIISYFASFLS